MVTEGLKFYVSTTAFRRRPLEEVIELAKREGLQLEFSSGIPHREDLERVFLEAGLPRLPHNYFPAPKKPFVLNLASTDPEVLEASIRHCDRGLELAKKSGAPFFSAHAGFCLDPRPSQLGEAFDPGALEASPEKHWTGFVRAVRRLGERARELGVRFLVENNVVIRANLRKDGTSPLFFSDAGDFERLAQETKGMPVGALIDTGHLKVSAHTLGFSVDEFMDGVAPYVGAFHHSDNSGEADTNHPIDERYWFLKYAPRFQSAVHVLEVHDQTVDQIRTQRTLLEKASFA